MAKEMSGNKSEPKKIAIKAMCEEIQARADKGEIMTLGSLAAQYGRSIEEMVDKINGFPGFTEDYEYDMSEAKFLKSAKPENEQQAAESEPAA